MKQVAPYVHPFLGLLFCQTQKKQKGKIQRERKEEQEREGEKKKGEKHQNTVSQKSFTFSKFKRPFFLS